MRGLFAVAITMLFALSLAQAQTDPPQRGRGRGAGAAEPGIRAPLRGGAACGSSRTTTGPRGLHRQARWLVPRDWGIPGDKPAITGLNRPPGLPACDHD